MPVVGDDCTISVTGQLVLREKRIVVPKQLRPIVLLLVHEGHLGIVGTKQNLRTKTQRGIAVLAMDVKSQQSLILRNQSEQPLYLMALGEI